MRWTDRMLTVGVFFSVFGGYLFAKGPAVTSQQLAFRIGVIAVGVALVIAAVVLKSSKRSGPP